MGQRGHEAEASTHIDGLVADASRATLDLRLVPQRRPEAALEIARDHAERARQVGQIAISRRVHKLGSEWHTIQIERHDQLGDCRGGCKAARVFDGGIWPVKLRLEQARQQRRLAEP